MQTRELTLTEVRKAYKEHICRDFPADERKPLFMIEKALKEQRYLCIGAFEDGEMAGAAFFVFESGVCLLDYFLVVPEKRSAGIGTAFLKAAASHITADVLIIEIEDPASAKTPDDATECTRRKSFYMNAGCIETGVRSRCFGVDYLLLEYPVSGGCPHSRETVINGYKKIYMGNLPKFMFEKSVKVE